MFNDDGLIDYGKNSEDLRSELLANGWDPMIQEPHDAECFIYLYDVLDTGYLYMMTGRLDAFKKAQSELTSLNDLAGIVGSIMKENITDPSMVIGASVTYFSKTETYRKLKPEMKNSSGKPVVIVLRYGHPRMKAVKLRPFALMHPTGVLSSEAIMEEAKGAINYDKSNHADWFPDENIVLVKPKFAR